MVGRQLASLSPYVQRNSLLPVSTVLTPSRQTSPCCPNSLRPAQDVRYRMSFESRLGRFKQENKMYGKLKPVAEKGLAQGE